MKHLAATAIPVLSLFAVLLRTSVVASVNRNDGNIEHHNGIINTNTNTNAEAHQQRSSSSLVADRFSNIRDPAFDHAIQRYLENATDDDERAHRSLQTNAETVDCKTELRKYHSKLLSQISPSTIRSLFGTYRADLLAFYYKALIDGNEDGEFFGIDGEYTNEILARMESIEEFYHTSSSSSSSSASIIFNPGTDEDGEVKRPSVLLGIHGSDLKSRVARVKICKLVRSSTAINCDNFADDLDVYIQRIPQKYDNPLLTMNALVVNKDSFKNMDVDTTSLKPSILFGDGILQYLEDSSVASEHDPDFVLAHEYGHVLQMVNGLFEVKSSGSIEASLLSKLELMADSLGAYYMAHQRGGALSVDDIDEVVNRAANLGDFTENSSSSGHGTPGQRECAAIWGARYAQQLPENIAPSFDEVVAAFEDAYEDIVNGDPSVCPGITAPLACSSSNSRHDKWGAIYAIAGAFGLYMHCIIM